MLKTFLSVLNMSLTGAFVIVAILLVRLPLKQAPKGISYALWAVAGFRLVFPFSIQGLFSLLPFKTAPIPLDIATQAIPRINSGVSIIDNAVSAVLPAAAPAASINPLQTWLAAGSYLWLFGIAAMLIYSAVSIVLLKHNLRGASQAGGNLREAKNLKTPFVIGFFSPMIYIPAELSEEERRYIILHERTHIRRGDYLVKMLAYFVLCLHWFNPLVWVAFIFMGADMEMSCDERVMRTLGVEIKTAYSLSLVRVAAGHTILNGSPLAFGEGGMKGRVKNVMNFKKHSRILIMAAVFVAAVVIAGLAMNGAGDSPFSGLETREITAIRVECSPPDVSINIEDGETIEKIKNLLRDVVVYQQDDSGRELSGQLVKYTLSMASGETVEVGAYGEFIYVNNVCYRAKLASSNALHELGNQLLSGTMPPSQTAMEILKAHYPGAEGITNLGTDTISYTNSPVMVFKYEFNFDGKTIVCAVEVNSGTFFTYEDSTWTAITDAFTGALAQKTPSPEPDLALIQARRLTQHLLDFAEYPRGEDLNKLEYSGDWDGDGKADQAYLSKNKLTVKLGCGERIVADSVALEGITYWGYGFLIQAGDLTGDGKNEILLMVNLGGNGGRGCYGLYPYTRKENNWVLMDAPYHGVSLVLDYTNSKATVTSGTYSETIADDEMLTAHYKAQGAPEDWEMVKGKPYHCENAADYICDIAVTQESGKTVVKFAQYVTGITGVHVDQLGYLVTALSYDADGAYSIVDMYFVLMPQ